MLTDMSWLVCLTKYTLTIVTFFHTRLISVKKKKTKTAWKTWCCFFACLFGFFREKKDILQEYKVA